MWLIFYFRMWQNIGTVFLLSFFPYTCYRFPQNVHYSFTKSWQLSHRRVWCWAAKINTVSAFITWHILAQAFSNTQLLEKGSWKWLIPFSKCHKSSELAVRSEFNPFNPLTLGKSRRALWWLFSSHLYVWGVNRKSARFAWGSLSWVYSQITCLEKDCSEHMLWTSKHEAWRSSQKHRGEFFGLFAQWTAFVGINEVSFLNVVPSSS